MMSHKEAFVTSLFVNVSLVVKIPLSEFKISSNSLISRTYKKEIVVFLRIDMTTGTWKKSMLFSYVGKDLYR